MSKSRLPKYRLPSFTGRGLGVGLLLACFVLGACSNDDDNINNGKNVTYTETSLSNAPVWAINWFNNQERPNWSKPDGSIYENWTTLMVKIEDALAPYVSADDIMGLFVNDEVRGLAKPAIAVEGNQYGSTKFLMKVYGNESGSESLDVTLSYYCQQLKHVFTLSESISMNSEGTLGIDEDFIPMFTLGSAKYPVVKTVTVEPMLTHAGLTPIVGNMVGVFVDEECRGLATLSADGSTQMVVYGRQTGEALTLKYYDAGKGVLYTIQEAAKI